jgi:hypothetical protein
VRAASLRRWTAWCVAIPTLLAGSQVAHALAYRLAYPSLPERVQILAASGHGYLAGLPLAFGLAGAVVVAALGWTVADAARGGPPTPIPPAVFATLPPLAFVIQELTERWLTVGGVPWWMVEQPTFRIGLLLQLPFGLLAYVAARVLLRGARALGRRVRSAGPPRPCLTRPVHSAAPAGLALVSGLRPSPWATRGPPSIRR